MSYTSSKPPFLRHAKGYFYICFLVSVFLVMVLWENGYSAWRPQHSYTYEEWDAKTIIKVVADEELSFPLQAEPSLVSSQKLWHQTSTTSTEESWYQQTTTPVQEPTHHSSAVPAWEKQQQQHNSYSTGGLDPEDVLIMFKTGATALWRRVPIHLSTSFSDSALTPNVVFYSDSPDIIVGHEVIDVLANVSSTLKESSDFELYHKAKAARENNQYLEDSSMDGDTYLPGGWRLDKYKFVPLAAHAATTYPDKKWYVYMEDDNYFFFESLYAWLASFDHTKPYLIGGPAARLGEDFAHGGSGFAISGAAMQQSFGADPLLVTRWDEYTQERCCGDQVLSHVLASKGVTRYRENDNSGTVPLQALPTWRMPVGSWNWCSPLMNVHKVHQADVSRLHDFEQRWKEKKGGPIRYRDLFTEVLLPTIIEERTEWDNYAIDKSYFSSQEGEDAGASLTDAERAARPWFSAASCKQACVDWNMCLSWRYSDDNCYLGHTAALGQRIDSGTRMVSGWMMERINGLQDKKCDALPWE